MRNEGRLSSHKEPFPATRLSESIAVQNEAATDVDYYTDNQSPPVYTENLYFKEKKMN